MKELSGKIGNGTLLSLFLLVTMLDAGGGFYVKYIMMLVLAVDILVHIREFRITKSELLVFVLMPVFNLLCSVGINHVGLRSAVSALTYNVAIIYMLWIRMKKIPGQDVLESLMRQLYIFAWVVIGSYLFLWAWEIAGQVAMGQKIAFFVRDRRAGLFGYDYFGSKIMPMVYWNASMFLIFAQALACHYKNRRYIIVIAAANLITMSTANVLLMGVILVLYLLSGDKKKRIMAVRFIAVCLLLAVIVFVVSRIAKGSLKTYVDDFLELAFSMGGSFIKIGHVRSAMKLILGSPVYLLLGMGGNSEFYSMGTKSIQTSMEVSQVECLRQFGLLYTVLFFAYIIYTMWKLWKEKYTMVCIGLVLLFVATATNPQLMSPMFLIVLFTCRYLTESKSSEDESLLKAKQDVL